MPVDIVTAFEFLVVLILVVLGLRVLAGREALGQTILRHAHYGADGSSGNNHRHITLGSKQIGLFHSHEDEESLAVGIIHGLAGSGGVVIALAAASQTVTGGAAFLIGFSLASILARGIASWAWGQAIGQSRSSESWRYSQRSCWVAVVRRNNWICTVRIIERWDCLAAIRADQLRLFSC